VSTYLPLQTFFLWKKYQIRMQKFSKKNNQKATLIEDNFTLTGLKSSSLFEKMSCSFDPTTNSETTNPKCLQFFSTSFTILVLLGFFSSKTI